MIHLRATADAGRGVFAGRDFAAGETVEQAPVIVIPAAEVDRIDETVLYFYYFLWGEDGESGAIALGMGSLYNHSYEPNVVYRKRFRDGMIDFIALRAIREGEEIRINYNGTPGDRGVIVFDGPAWHKVSAQP